MGDSERDEVLNPVDIENKIRDLTNQISKGVNVVSSRYGDKLTAERIYDHAFAVAFLAYEGPQGEKRYAAEKATAKERQDRDVADVAYRHAERQMRALEGQLSALQTISKSVQMMYGAAGRGQ